MADSKTILLVDDSENDLLLMRLAFEQIEMDLPLHSVEDGEEAIAYLDGQKPYEDRTRHPLPVLVLLDLNMPRKHGFEVLTWVRSNARLRRIPFVILSASMRPADVQQAYELGAHSFLVKPAKMEDLVAMLRCLREWLLYNHFPPANQWVRH
jgi:CheY-like chemotaxis protein